MAALAVCLWGARGPSAAAQAPAPAADPGAPIAWSSMRGLVWSQYRGRPDPAIGAMAMTVYSLAYEEQCDGTTFTFSAIPQFEPAKSWVTTSALASGAASARLLTHEQGHFDLAEVHARRLRKALRELPDPCLRVPEERRAMVLSHLRQDRDRQARYDQETAYGSDVRRQTIWSGTIERELKALAEFADVH
jgi:hypothetical protein